MINFEDVVYLVRSLESRESTDYVITGSFVVSDESKLNLVNTIQSDDSGEIELSSTSTPIRLGDAVSIEMRKSGSRYRIAGNVNDLLKNHNNLTKPAKSYYLLDDDYASNEPVVVGSSVSKYHAAILIFQMLDKAALFSDSTSSFPVLHLIQDNAKFSIPIKYEMNDLNSDIELYSEKLKQFVGSDDAHYKQRLQIVAEVVCELTNDRTESERFIEVLNKIKDVLQTVENRYVLFTSDFKYSKVKDDFVLAKINFSQKINDVLMGIQTQLISIPIGLIAVFTQMTVFDKIFSNKFAINSVVLLSALGITMLLEKLITNQKAVLNSIEEEIKRQDDLLKRQHVAIKDDFLPLVSSLKDRIDSQNSALRLLNNIVWASFIISTIYFFLQFPCVREFLKRFL